MIGLILVRLEANEIPVLKSASIILNTEGWEQAHGEFVENEIHTLFGEFEIPLRNAGLSCTLDELIEEWQALLAYATSYLNPTGQSYSRIWYKILNYSRKSEWCNILLLVELLFCLPVLNAVVERLFSVMKRIKTRLRSSMGQIRLSHLIRIKMGGHSLAEFDATAAITLWSTKSTHRPNHCDRKRYKSKHVNAKKVKVLIDESSTDSEDELIDNKNDDDTINLADLMQIL